MKLSLISSNENKLKEFKRFGLTDLDIKKGVDLDEVDSNPLTVIIYKSQAAGLGTIVEDTSLTVDGENVGTNIRWLLNELDKFDGKAATWEVMLAVNNGENILVYQGIQTGKISSKKLNVEGGFGFDPYFIPESSIFTLSELENKGMKDLFSARKKAVENLINNEIHFEQRIVEIKPWNGKMQQEEVKKPKIK